MKYTNHIYRVFWPAGPTYKEESVCYVVASTPGQAKSIAVRHSHKTMRNDFISLRVRIDRGYEENYFKYPHEFDFNIHHQQHLYDIETYADYQEEILREYWADL